MTYDSSLPLSALYRWWGARQVMATCRAIQGTDAALLIGIPASEERTRSHHPRAENVESGLLGTLDGLANSQGGCAALVGVAIYPYWEFDLAEQALYRELWLDSGVCR
jgi:hypothetical protein